MHVEGAYLLVVALVLYYHAASDSDCNDLRIACIAVCTNEVSLMNTEQPILWDYTVQAARVQVIV